MGASAGDGACVLVDPRLCLMMRRYVQSAVVAGQQAAARVLLSMQPN